MNQETSISNIIDRAKAIKCLILDVDGVLTDGKLHYSDHGVEIKSFNVKDGLGIKLLMHSGIHVAIISARQSACVKQRMRELNVPFVYLGQQNKMTAYLHLLEKLQLRDHDIAYIGDDLPDLTLVQRVGLGIVPADANSVVMQHADWVCQKAGGNGCVREVADTLLKAQDKLNTLIESEYRYNPIPENA